jgi:hypothetical protein
MLFTQLHCNQLALVDHLGAIVLVLLVYSSQGTKGRYKPFKTDFSEFVMLNLFRFEFPISEIGNFGDL